MTGHSDFHSGKFVVVAVDPGFEFARATLSSEPGEVHLSTRQAHKKGTA